MAPPRASHNLGWPQVGLVCEAPGKPFPPPGAGYRIHYTTRDFNVSTELLSTDSWTEVKSASDKVEKCGPPCIRAARDEAKAALDLIIFAFSQGNFLGNKGVFSRNKG